MQEAQKNAHGANPSERWSQTWKMLVGLTAYNTW